MEQDVKLLFTSTATATTAEEILTVVTAVANSLCEILGLKIIPSLSVTHGGGGACYLGITEEDEDPLIVVATGTYGSYWGGYVYIGGINSLKLPMDWQSWNQSKTSGFGYWSPSSYTKLGALISYTQANTYISYLKTDNGDIYFSLGTPDNMPSGYNFNIFKLNNSYIFSTFYSGDLFFSYNKIMNNTGYNTYITQKVMTYNSTFLNLQPEQNNTIADMYYLDYKFPFKFYSNKEGYAGGHQLTIKNKNYLCLYYYNSAWTSCILPIDEEDNNDN